MRLDTAALRDKVRELDCPILDGSAKKEYLASAKAANVYSLAVLEFLRRKTPKEQVAWLKTSVGATREVFQPWNVEILYVLATLGHARFSDLEALLGLSSRTLSDKLKQLKDVGLVERTVFDEQPVRVEYKLTKHGLRTASLASPLFTHLTLDAIQRA